MKVPTRADLVSATVAGLAIFASPALVSPARACSPPESPPRYFAFDRATPADGTRDVFRDGAIVFDLEVQEGERRQTSNGESVPELVVIVSDLETGMPVQGNSVFQYRGAGEIGVWRPSAMMAAGRRYHVEAELRSPGLRPAGARGPDRLSFTFETGLRTLPPLTTRGRPAASIELVERDRYGSNCGGLCTCEPSGRELAPSGRLRLPPVTGGQADRGYTFNVIVTAGRPYDFATREPANGPIYGGTGGEAHPGVVTETSAEIIVQNGAHKPCFAWQVQDVSGRELTGEPVCLDEVVSSAKPVEPEAGGCTVVPGRQGGHFGWMLSIGVLGVLAALGRRASRSRPQRPVIAAP